MMTYETAVELEELIELLSRAANGKSANFAQTHHSSLHTMGDEENWWKERQTDPVAHAMRLWQEIRNQTMPVAKAKDLILPLPG